MSGFQSLHNHTIPLLEGGVLDFSDLAGRHVLLVNVASECGHTPQYQALQELQESARDRIVVVGLPCNDFGGQEPGNATAIRTFCTTRYGVTFPLTEKVRFRTEPLLPLVRWLTLAEVNGVADTSVDWNFTKFVAAPDGRWKGSFAPAVHPLDELILRMLEIHGTR